MKTVDIKGKPYVEVSERIKHFRANFEGYSLSSKMISNENGVCVFIATIRDENDRIIATGHAYEKEGNSYINKTSYIENCETSAWGRALANLGIGIDAAVASADEVVNAISNQEPNRSDFCTPDSDEKELAELKKALAKAVSDMLIDPSKMAETISKAETKSGEALTAYVIQVIQHINKLRGEK